MRYPTLLATVVLAGACARAENFQQMQARIRAESDSMKTHFQAVAQRFGAWFGAGQADSLAATYAVNAHLMPPGMPAVVGRDSIRAWFAGYFSQGPAGELTLQVLDASANGPMAVERGRWKIVPPAGSPMTADSGKYLAHWHQIEGNRWQLVDDIWNSDVPPPPPPPRRR
jgi:ketosteroid isomerase-like protein